MTCKLLLPILLCIPVSMMAAEPPVFTVRGPTIIAFFTPTQKDVDNNQDLAEVVSDFQHYLEEAREPFRKARITLREVYAPSFRLSFRRKPGAKTITFRPEIQVGYYFIAPGKEPRIERDGVEPATGLFEIAHEYFGIAVK
jgi:hypothetical protein